MGQKRRLNRHNREDREDRADRADRENGADEDAKSVRKRARKSVAVKKVQREVYLENTEYQREVDRLLIKFKVFETERKAMDFIKERFLRNNMKGYKQSRKFRGTRCSPVPQRIPFNGMRLGEYESEPETESVIDPTVHLVAFPECIGKSIDEIVALKIGISNSTKYRKVYSQVDKRWVVYWRN